MRVGGLAVNDSSYCYDLDKGWIALASPPPAGVGNVEIDYVYSIQPDLVVTNWDPNDPNIGFLNDVTTSVAQGAPARLPFLLPNYPEPFNPSTIIPYRLDQESRVDIVIYDLRGRQVKTLYAGRAAAGLHELPWDGTDRSYREVASGIYFYRIDTENFTDTRRMTLIR